MTIWFDVDDLIRFFQGAVRPTGIQRFNFETCSAAVRLAGAEGEIQFCRRTAGGLIPIHFPSLEAGIYSIAETPYTPIAPPQPEVRRLHPALGRLARTLAPQIRGPLGRMARAFMVQLGALRELARLGLAACRPRAARPTPRLGGHAFDLDTNPIQLGHGDWLVNLGASWEQPYSDQFLTELRRAGAGFALLAHDMIPDLFPEWCTDSMVRDFRAWLDDIVPRTDVMFTVSQNTARDLRAAQARRGRSLASPIVLPAGGPACRISGLLPPVLDEPYVLMVGTIEARKNHAGMLRVWRRLLSTLPPETVPALVFAGKPGWLTADLMQQLENSSWLDGKIRFINQPEDSVLASLYQHCLFTLFPSFYEGWGLPVSKSLSLGKPVAASNSPAIAEAGGAFCAYFDPDNLSEASRVIADLITQPGRLGAMTARIAAAYRAPRWEDTASALLARLGMAPRAEPCLPEISTSLPPDPLPARPAQA